MQARDIMTTDVRTVGPETPVRDIAAMLLEHRISAVPVVDETGHVIGIVSEGDLMRRPEAGTVRRRSWWLELFADAETLARDYVKSHGLHAADVMTRHVVSVSEDTQVADIATLLESRRIKRVPVVRDGILVGIVSRADLLRVLATPASPQTPGPAAGRNLHDELMQRIAAEPWSRSMMINVVVRDGTVELWGICRSQEEKQALRTLVERVPGVRAVDDRISVVHSIAFAD